MKTKRSKVEHLLHGIKTGFLPTEYHLAHAYCFFIHDLIVQTLIEGEKAEAFHIIIDELSDAKKISLKSNESIIDWLEKNGYQDEASMLYFKQIIKAMISDFGHFTYEALNCSQKGKLSVTFALLRKAFKDHLIYFEWLLGDPADFMNIFSKGAVHELALDRNAEKRKIIIKKAMDKLNSYWGNPEFLYEIRYDKKSSCGFEAMWQQANHLITTCENYKTSPKNFNFIFSNSDNMKRQWSILYTLLPVLLTHAYHIIETLFKQFAKRVNEKNDITDLRVMMGFSVWQDQYFPKEKTADIINKYFSVIGLDKVPCPSCTFHLDFTKENKANFYGAGLIKCKNCKTKINFLEHELSAYLVKLFK